MNERNNKPEQTIRHYITDMIGLENYFCDVLEQQIKDENVKKYPQAEQCIRQAKIIIDQHVNGLKQHASLIEGNNSPIAAVKEAVTDILGGIKGLYEKMRSDAVSKMLRDNYVISNLICIGYSMLHTTALACNDAATANLALRNLNDLPPIVMDLNEVIPQIVVDELNNQGKVTDSAAAGEAIRNIQEAWKSKVSTHI
jgi:hypothetical protein